MLCVAVLIVAISYAKTTPVFKPTILLTNQTHHKLLYFYKGLEANTPNMATAKKLCGALSIPGLAYLPLAQENMSVTTFFQPVNVGCVLIGKRAVTGKFEKLGMLVAAIHWQEKTLTESYEKINNAYASSVTLQKANTVVNAIIQSKKDNNALAPKTVMIQYPYH